MSVLLSTATTTTHMLCGVTVLDLIVQRGLKSKRPGGQCGVIVTDIEVQCMLIVSVLDLTFCLILQFF